MPIEEREPRERDARPIGAILTGQGKLDALDVARILELQRREGMRFGEAARYLGLISEDDLRFAVAKQFDAPHLLPGNRGRSSELVAVHAPFHACAEAMRALRTQLLLRWAHAKTRHRMLVITSPGPREGRSYLAANLAVVFAQLGERTLLVDADLRRPRQHQIFNVDDRVGLSAVLSGRAEGQAGVVAIPDLGSLSLLPAGAPPPNPQELLSGAALHRLLGRLREDYDVILFDTPPAKRCADAHGVAALAGGALVLARRDHTRLEDTNDVVRELGDTGVNVAGTVMTAF